MKDIDDLTDAEQIRHDCPVCNTRKKELFDGLRQAGGVMQIKIKCNEGHLTKAEFNISGVKFVDYKDSFEKEEW